MDNGNQLAFACANEYGYQKGMTKRELFAAMALQGICANSIPGQHHRPENTAIAAIKAADALLAELEQEKE